ncbi:otoferlin isoform X4 [Neocloeon triangulifer]|uniref:otoferlin isoform X4 n=1 Tax=Neocloeon triangulifer TaxID=2078957 RepID=UPI00286F6807|nr:otoferlin isoform X4 [Neocloeon triangulifer]
MALVVRLREFFLPKCKGDKLAKIEFRGVAHTSRLMTDSGDLQTLDQLFEWPIGRPIEPDETVSVALVLHSRLLPDRSIGHYIVPLQKVVKEGKLSLRDSLLDNNAKTLPATISLEMRYTVPGTDDSIDGWSPDEGMDEERLLVDIQQNIANLEKTLTSNERRASWSHEQASTSRTIDKSPAPGRKRSALRSMRSLIRLGKQRPPRDVSSEDEERALLQGGRSGLDGIGTPVGEQASSRAGSQSSLESDNDSLLDANSLDVTKKRLRASHHQRTPSNLLKSQDFQLCITIIEARQLAGLNMDPVVCVQVGDQKKYTSVKESTNCPYYNEYFVFDFHMPPMMLFDKIITLSVLQSRNILRHNKMLGSFKLDVATVWSQPDHQFYHKWALLSDPDDFAGGPKGYLKCDISVIGKGDSVKVPPKSEKDEDDIEANLLLPEGVPVERQRARFIVRVYRADGLPKMNSSIMANVKRAFTGEVKDLVDPYVQVSFAGLTGKTSVKKNCYAPVWNEQIVFSEMFPPLCQRIKIQLRDNDQVNNTIIGTHFIDLKTISNDGEKGFLPTFGPAFIHLYGSTRDYSLLDEHASLNSGLGEGVSYRARLLVAIRTEITDNIDIAPSGVEVEPSYPITESNYGKNEEYFLFGSIMDATMIDKKLGDKPLFFELSIGNAGNSLDGHNSSSQEIDEEEGDDYLDNVSAESACWQSTTPPVKPMTHDRLYHFLPYWDDKPCMYVRSVWPDYRRRMYNSNLIMRIIEKLEEGLLESHLQIEADSPNMEKTLKQTLDDLAFGCGKYLSISRCYLQGTAAGKTKLDRERMKLCVREIEHIASLARNLKALVAKHTIKERYKTAQSYLQRLRYLAEDPQHALPDIFLWLVSGGKRVAYQRLQAKDLIFSVVGEESGKDCGKVQTLLLKVKTLPGKRGIGVSGWVIQAKLRIYLWLGLTKHKKNFVSGLPAGYEVSQEIKSAERPRALPPSVIHFTEKHYFQLRAHMYQARSLIGSDASGLSDPYAQVVAGEWCKTTQVVDETLSPTWDELLVFPELMVCGLGEEIKKEPPNIVIEIFDQDKVGKSEFIGRAMAKPHVKLLSEPYEPPKFPPKLEWFDINRGVDHAGELLAMFEMLEVDPGQLEFELPALPSPKDCLIPITQDTGPILPVPPDIRPTLSKYRIEVLFWGLRDVKRVHLLTVDKPRVDIECAGHILHSSVITNARKNPNFSTPVKFIDLELPEQELYCPPLTVRVVDCRSFGRYTLVGTHMINSIHRYLFNPVTKKQREVEERKKSQQLQPNHTAADPWANSISTSNYIILDTDETDVQLRKLANSGPGTLQSKREKTESNRKRKMSMGHAADDDEDSKDWWTKYFASVEAMIEETKKAKNEEQDRENQQNGACGQMAEGSSGGHEEKKKIKLGFKSAGNAAKIANKWSPKAAKHLKPKTALLKIFPSELEAQPEFNAFKEWLQTFDLLRGKKTGEETEDDSRVVGKFKGNIKVYKWPLPKDIDDHTIMGFDPQYGFFQGLPSSDPIHVLVRVYVVKGTDLHPMDLNGKADPYVVLQLGSKRISDKEHYISKQLNPVFGRCFEFEATFPQDSLLTVQVWDWDLVGSDDLIGETRIDLENRFYTRHRATCGLPSKYEEYGYNAWRDPMKPTQILAKLCKEGKLEPPSYFNGKVKVGNKTFGLNNDDVALTRGGKSKHYYFAKLLMNSSCVSLYVRAVLEEYLALAVLKRWDEFPRIGCKLVPEHVETRPLYNAEKPGIEQGKLELWVDMFPMDMPLPGPPLDIAPRKPKSYELRIVIWNTDEVVLEDDAFFTGEKMSDIYVKGWLKGPEDCQYTDIHYRSLTGEGNFNWRFIFPFDYLVAEEKIVISRKESLFSWDETESKIPARLELQVWDADHFSADDFLGAITLDLNRFPRGAKSSKLCTLDMLKTDGSVPMVNIFKQKRLKGWWPFYIKKENEEMELTGKVEAEIHLLTHEEAEKNPAGMGRNEPDPLDKPNRPDASFMWFLNPFKSIRYIVWHNYKWTIIKGLIFTALAIMLLLFFYSVPGYSVKKLLGA